MSKILEDINWLINWFDKNGNNVRFDGRTPINNIPLIDLKNRLSKLSSSLEIEFPEYSERIFQLKDQFLANFNTVNVATYGRISEALSVIKIILSSARLNKWHSIHPLFQGEVKRIFLLESYKASENEAISIIMARLKNIFNSIIDKEIDIEGTNLVEKLFSEKDPIIILCHTNTKTGENIQKGYSLYFRGWVYALRNRNSHLGDYEITELSAFREIEFMSMLMTALDNRISPPLLDSEKYDE